MAPAVPNATSVEDAFPDYFTPKQGTYSRKPTKFTETIRGSNVTFLRSICYELPAGTRLPSALQLVNEPSCDHDMHLSLCVYAAAPGAAVSVAAPPTAAVAAARDPAARAAPPTTAPATPAPARAPAAPATPAPAPAAAFVRCAREEFSGHDCAVIADVVRLPWRICCMSIRAFAEPRPWDPAYDPSTWTACKVLYDAAGLLDAPLYDLAASTVAALDEDGFPALCDAAPVLCVQLKDLLVHILPAVHVPEQDKIIRVLNRFVVLDTDNER
eukprot:m.65545 g.65545  ORF g.65545 m.65545 type:complete len:271 (-) comp7330_c0_seq2:182-994(-)